MSDFDYPKHYDVIVLGAGHAGIEAALAAARLGCATMLLTQNADTVGQMSCNPAIGGLAKGHMVREIDALGGVMGLNTDATGIQFRMLNARKGPSVRAPRAQCDKKAYQFRLKSILEQTPNLDLKQGNATRLLVENDAVVGIETNLGLRFLGRSIVVTTGTFMRGLLHVGLRNQAGGRLGDTVSTLSDSLRDLGFEVGRFKTGTPCRLLAKSIDFTVCDRQDGDEPAPLFSYIPETVQRGEDDIFTLNHWENGALQVRQIPCWITHTNEKTHEIIRANLDKSPLYAGVIEGVGPRYCPSVEDKVHRFADKTSHQIFIEPEGLTTHEIYPNGISTSLPFDVQYALVRSMKGFENAHITRPGYAIEYDYFDPRDLKPSLETRFIAGLFFAGQINGTTGYEEAAAQGLLAGINASLQVSGQEPWSPRRDEAYVGVLVDDLITRGTSEPYRMFTSRAEYRLLLREDNADLRLTPKGRELGLVDDERWEFFERKRVAIAEETQRLTTTVVHPYQMTEELAVQTLGTPLLREAHAYALLRRPEVSYEALTQLPPVGRPDWMSGAAADERLVEQVQQQLEVQAKYTGYIDRQQDEIERQRRHEQTRLPDDIDFAQVRGLSTEVRQRLKEVRPATLGQASRVPGVTPAAISLLLVHLKRRSG